MRDGSGSGSEPEVGVGPQGRTRVEPGKALKEL